MHKFLLLTLFCAFVSIKGISQTTYLSDTAFTTDAGFGGASASCIAMHEYYFGWQMGRAQNSWCADVFTVPTGQTWLFDSVIVYGYQSGSGLTSTFLNCNLQIYKGTPGLGGTIVWGDTGTNVLSSTGFTGIYRVDTVTAHGGLMGTNRPIMYLKLYLATPANLPAGTYWLAWSTAGSLPANSCPDKVLPGRLNPPLQTARQLVGGNWSYVIDSSKDIGFNKIIKARAGLTTATAVVHSSKFELMQNYPNPFSNQTKITFCTAKNENVTLSVYNAYGICVATPYEGYIANGPHQIDFTTDNLPAGIYFYQLKTEEGTESRQMLLVR